MTSQSQDVEVLVHVTAPSRSRDDVVYRQLAQACLAFQPQQRLELLPPHSSQEPNDGALRKEPDLQSQDLSFQSALDNRSEPALPISQFKSAQDNARFLSPAGDDSAQSSWAPPSSEISDSYPMPDADLLHVSPTRVLQRYLGRTAAPARSSTIQSASKDALPSQEIDSSPGLLAKSSLPLPAVSPARGHDQPQPQDQSALRAGLTDVIPLTPIGANSVARSRKATDHGLNDSVVNETTHIQSSLPSCSINTSSFRAESEPPPSKRLKTASGLVGEPLSLVRSSSDSCQPKQTPAAKRLDYSHEIRPPSPPVGVSDVKPADLVSKKLSKLAHDLSSRYRPITKRGIESFNRGYWLLDCTGWNSRVRHETWVFLKNYVGSGLAGWGVWCHRDPSHNWIRLYCWGHIVKHTYLLLYLASGRQLKATGATWIDADGNVALEVLPHDRQT